MNFIFWKRPVKNGTGNITRPSSGPMVITLVLYRSGVGSISTRSPILATLWHTTPVHGHPLGMVIAPLQRGYTTSTTKPVVFRHVL